MHKTLFLTSDINCDKITVNKQTGGIIMVVCVFGASSSKIDSDYIKKVEELGGELAKNGHSVVFGAGFDGLMGAVARGAKKNGGQTIGIVPQFFIVVKLSDIFECDELICTDSMHTRKKKMEDLSDAFVIVPGGIGTLEEFFEVLTLKQLCRHQKPIVLYDINGYYKKLDDFMLNAEKEGFFGANTRSLYKTAATAEEVIRFIESTEKHSSNVRDLRYS